jgi:hypothetical protein
MCCCLAIKFDDFLLPRLEKEEVKDGEFLSSKILPQISPLAEIRDLKAKEAVEA